MAFTVVEKSPPNCGRIKKMGVSISEHSICLLANFPRESILRYVEVSIDKENEMLRLRFFKTKAQNLYHCCPDKKSKNFILYRIGCGPTIRNHCLLHAEITDVKATGKHTVVISYKKRPPSAENTSFGGGM